MATSPHTLTGTKFPPPPQTLPTKTRAARPDFDRETPSAIAANHSPHLRACLSVRFQGLTPTPQYRPSASSRLWPARPAALCLPDPCGLGSDSHGVKVFSGKLLKFLTQTGSNSR